MTMALLAHSDISVSLYFLLLLFSVTAHQAGLGCRIMLPLSSSRHNAM